MISCVISHNHNKKKKPLRKIHYSSVRETDWSLEIAGIIVATEWKCSNCDGTFNLTGVQKLQHTNGN